MPQRNSSHAQARTQPHNRLQERLPPEEAAAKAAQEAEETELSPDELNERLKGYMRGRKQSRRIDTSGQEEHARSIDEAVVTTTKGIPDMRFAENRNKFMKDQTKKVTGRPDFRFLENRPDILKLHVERGEDRPNLIFNDDGDVEE